MLSMFSQKMPATNYSANLQSIDFHPLNTEFEEFLGSLELREKSEHIVQWFEYQCTASIFSQAIGKIEFIEEKGEKLDSDFRVMVNKYNMIPSKFALFIAISERKFNQPFSLDNVPNSPLVTVEESCLRALLFKFFNRVHKAQQYIECNMITKESLEMRQYPIEEARDNAVGKVRVVYEEKYRLIDERLEAFQVPPSTRRRITDIRRAAALKNELKALRKMERAEINAIFNSFKERSKNNKRLMRNCMARLAYHQGVVFFFKSTITNIRTLHVAANPLLSSSM
jgi:hypothetical protein